MPDLNKIKLRVPIQDDAELILSWENDKENWEVSENDSLYTLEDIRNLITELKDPVVAGQARYMITTGNDNLGAVDLFQIDFNEGKAGVGILIADKNNRRKGIALKALQLVEKKALALNVNYLTATIHTNNEPSLKLFEKAGYTKKQSAETTNLPNADYLQTILVEKWLNDL